MLKVNFIKNFTIYNNRKNKIIRLIVILIIIFTTLLPQSLIPSLHVTAASEQQPSDDLQKKSAETLRRLGVIAGYEDGSLHLEYPIKRSEFSTLAVKLMGKDLTGIPNGGIVYFKDMPAEHWAYSYIQAAYTAGYVKGYPDGTFGPENQITYAEAITVLTKALGYSGTPSMDWPNNFISKAGEIQLLKNIDLTPNHSMTRGEICILLYNSLTIDFKS